MIAAIPLGTTCYLKDSSMASIEISRVLSRKTAAVSEFRDVVFEDVVIDNTNNRCCLQLNY